MAARHRPFRESKVEKDRREAKEREEEKLALSKKALTQPYNVYDEWDKYKKDCNVKIPAGPAASISTGVRAHQHDSWGVRKGAREQCGGDITHCSGVCDESRGS